MRINLTTQSVKSCRGANQITWGTHMTGLSNEMLYESETLLYTQAVFLVSFYLSADFTLFFSLHVRRTDKRAEARYHDIEEYMVHVRKCSVGALNPADPPLTWPSII